MYTGIGIMSFAIFPYLQIAGILFFSLQYYFIVSEEEKYLRSTFNKQYDNYTANVPRFFPRLKSYKVSKIERPNFSWKEGFKSETRTLQAFSFIIFTLIVIWYWRRF